MKSKFLIPLILFFILINMAHTAHAITIDWNKVITVAWWYSGFNGNCQGSGGDVRISYTGTIYYKTSTGTITSNIGETKTCEQGEDQLSSQSGLFLEGSEGDIYYSLYVTLRCCKTSSPTITTQAVPFSPYSTILIPDKGVKCYDADGEHTGDNVWSIIDANTETKFPLRLPGHCEITFPEEQLLSAIEVIPSSEARLSHITIQRGSEINDVNVGNEMKGGVTFRFDFQPRRGSILKLFFEKIKDDSVSFEINPLPKILKLSQNVPKVAFKRQKINVQGFTQKQEFLCENGRRSVCVALMKTGCNENLISADCAASAQGYTRILFQCQTGIQKLWNSFVDSVVIGVKQVVAGVLCYYGMDIGCLGLIEFKYEEYKEYNDLIKDLFYGSGDICVYSRGFFYPNPQYRNSAPKTSTDPLFSDYRAACMEDYGKYLCKKPPENIGGKITITVSKDNEQFATQTIETTDGNYNYEFTPDEPGTYQIVTKATASASELTASTYQEIEVFDITTDINASLVITQKTTGECAEPGGNVSYNVTIGSYTTYPRIKILKEGKKDFHVIEDGTLFFSAKITDPDKENIKAAVCEDMLCEKILCRMEEKLFDPSYYECVISYAGGQLDYYVYVIDFDKNMFEKDYIRSDKRTIGAPKKDYDFTLDPILSYAPIDSRQSIAYPVKLRLKNAGKNQDLYTITPTITKSPEDTASWSIKSMLINGVPAIFPLNVPLVPDQVTEITVIVGVPQSIYGAKLNVNVKSKGGEKTSVHTIPRIGITTYPPDVHTGKYNAFSLPYVPKGKITIRNISNCEINAIAYWDNKNNKYIIKTDDEARNLELTNGIGYFINVTNPYYCEIFFDSRLFQTKDITFSMTSGWNLIGSSSGFLKYKDIKGSCPDLELDGGKAQLYRVNPEKGYRKTDTIIPGYAHWFKTMTGTGCSFTVKSTLPYDGKEIGIHVGLPNLIEGWTYEIAETDGKDVNVPHNSLKDVTLVVTNPGSQQGTYNFDVSISSSISSDTELNRTKNVAYSVVNPSVPELTIDPNSKYGLGGDELKYNIMVENKNNKCLKPMDFNVPVELPSGFSGKLDNVPIGTSGSMVIKALHLIANPGFEEDFKGWLHPYGTESIDTTVQHSGSKSAKISFTDSTGTGVLRTYDITVEENKEYEISFWAKGDANNMPKQAPVVAVFHYNADDKLILPDGKVCTYEKRDLGGDCAYSSWVSVPDIFSWTLTKDWSKATLRFKARPGAVKIAIQIDHYHNPGTVYYDDFSFTRIVELNITSLLLFPPIKDYEFNVSVYPVGFPNFINKTDGYYNVKIEIPTIIIEPDELYDCLVGKELNYTVKVKNNNPSVWGLKPVRFNLSFTLPPGFNGGFLPPRGDFSVRTKDMTLVIPSGELREANFSIKAPEYTLGQHVFSVSVHPDGYPDLNAIANGKYVLTPPSSAPEIGMNTQTECENYKINVKNKDDTRCQTRKFYLNTEFPETWGSGGAVIKDTLGNIKGISEIRPQQSDSNIVLWTYPKVRGGLVNFLASTHKPSGAFGPDIGTTISAFDLATNKTHLYFTYRDRVGVFDKNTHSITYMDVYNATKIAENSRYVFWIQSYYGNSVIRMWDKTTLPTAPMLNYSYGDPDKNEFPLLDVSSLAADEDYVYSSEKNVIKRIGISDRVVDVIAIINATAIDAFGGYVYFANKTSIGKISRDGGAVTHILDLTNISDIAVKVNEIFVTINNGTYSKILKINESSKRIDVVFGRLGSPISVAVDDYYIFFVDGSDVKKILKFGLTGVTGQYIRVCGHNKPTINIMPEKQVGFKGDVLDYTIEIKNNNRLGIENIEGPMTFNVKPDLPIGLGLVGSEPSVVIESGKSGSVTLKINSTENSIAETEYKFNVVVSTEDPDMTNATEGYYNVVNPEIPGITISPINQYGLGGDELKYTVSVTNRNLAGWKLKPMDINVSVDLPSGFGGKINGIVRNSIIVRIGSGITSSIELNITSPSNPEIKDYEFTVSAYPVGYPDIKNTTEGHYIVEINTQTIEIIPAEQYDCFVGELNYTVRVNNTNRVGIRQMEFTLSFNLPLGFGGGLKDDKLLISSGRSGITTLTIKAPEYALETHGFSVGVHPTGYTEKNATTDGEYVIEQPNTPLVSIGEITAGEMYSVTVTNKDSEKCQPRKFYLNTEFPETWGSGGAVIKDTPGNIKSESSEIRPQQSDSDIVLWTYPKVRGGLVNFLASTHKPSGFGTITINAFDLATNKTHLYFTYGKKIGIFDRRVVNHISITLDATKIAENSRYVFWIEKFSNEGVIRMWDKTSLPTAPSLVYLYGDPSKDDFPLSEPTSLAADEDYVYSSEKNAIKRIRISDGAAQNIATINTIAIDAFGGYVYFANKTSIGKIPRDGGAVTHILNLTNISDIAVKVNEIFVTINNGSYSKILRINETTKKIDVVFGRLGSPISIAVDDYYIFFVDGSDVNKILKFGLTGVAEQYIRVPGHNKPAINIMPEKQVGFKGDVLDYTIEIKNNNARIIDAMRFNVKVDLPNGLDLIYLEKTFVRLGYQDIARINLKLNSTIATTDGIQYMFNITVGTEDPDMTNMTKGQYIAIIPKVPSIRIVPIEKHGLGGQTVDYTVYVKNNNPGTVEGIGVRPMDFNVSVDLPSGFSSKFNGVPTNSIIIGNVISGAEREIELNITSPANPPVGDYKFTVSVYPVGFPPAQYPNLLNSTIGIYNVSINTPSITIIPVGQYGLGEDKFYTVSVTNKNNPAWDVKAMDFIVNITVPDGLMINGKTGTFLVELQISSGAYKETTIKVNTTVQYPEPKEYLFSAFVYPKAYLDIKSDVANAYYNVSINKPSITIEPVMRYGVDKQEISYKVSIKNQNEVLWNVRPMDFNVSVDLPAGFSSKFNGVPANSMIVRNVISGAEPRIELNITSLLDYPAIGDYEFTVSVYPVGYSDLNSTIKAYYNVSINVPGITISPVNQYGLGGDELTYSISVKNINLPQLKPTDFNVSVDLPSGFGGKIITAGRVTHISGSGSIVINMNSQATSFLELNITSPQYPPIGSHEFNVSVYPVGYPDLNSTTKGYYNVSINVPEIWLVQPTQHDCLIGELNYTVRVANMNRGELRPMNFTLSFNLPSGFYGRLENTLTIPSTGFRDANLTINTTKQVLGTHGFSVSAYPTGYAGKTATTDGRYVIEQPNTPLVSIAEVTVGRVYSVTVTNNDSSVCQARKFYLNVEFPKTYWGVKGVNIVDADGNEINEMELKPGESGNVGLRLTPVNRGGLVNFLASTHKPKILGALGTLGIFDLSTNGTHIFFSAPKNPSDKRIGIFNETTTYITISLENVRGIAQNSKYVFWIETPAGINDGVIRMYDKSSLPALPKITNLYGNLDISDLPAKNAFYLAADENYVYLAENSGVKKIGINKKDVTIIANINNPIGVDTNEKTDFVYFVNETIIGKVSKDSTCSFEDCVFLRLSDINLSNATDITVSDKIFSTIDNWPYSKILKIGERFEGIVFGNLDSPRSVISNDYIYFVNRDVDVVKITKYAKTGFASVHISVPGHNKPTINIMPEKQVGLKGEVLNYIIEIKNNNALRISKMRFYIKLDLPDGLSLVHLENTSVYLESLKNATITLKLNSTKEGAHEFNVVVSTEDPEMTNSSKGQYIAFIPPNPSIRIVPIEKYGFAGETVNYTVYVKNNNPEKIEDIGVREMIFAFSVDALPTNWKWIIPQLTVASGEEKTAILSITSPVTEKRTYEFNLIVYPIRPVRYQDINASVKGYYVVYTPAPLVSIEPKEHKGLPIEYFNYTINITNRDTVSARFNISVIIPEKWIAKFNRIIDIDSRMTKTTRLEVSPNNSAPGTYNITINISNADEPNIYVEKNVSYIVTKFSEPIVEVIPSSQEGLPGQTKAYIVKITNKDPVTTYFYQSVLVPEKWTGTLEKDLVTVLPLSSANIKLDITSPQDASEGRYDFKVIVKNAQDINIFNQTYGTFLIVFCDRNGVCNLEKSETIENCPSDCPDSEFICGYYKENPSRYECDLTTPYGVNFSAKTETTLNLFAVCNRTTISECKLDLENNCRAKKCLNGTKGLAVPAKTSYACVDEDGYYYLLGTTFANRDIISPNYTYNCPVCNLSDLRILHDTSIDWRDIVGETAVKASACAENYRECITDVPLENIKACRDISLWILDVMGDYLKRLDDVTKNPYPVERCHDITNEGSDLLSKTHSEYTWACVKFERISLLKIENISVGEAVVDTLTKVFVNVSNSGDYDHYAYVSCDFKDNGNKYKTRSDCKTVVNKTSLVYEMDITPRKAGIWKIEKCSVNASLLRDCKAAYLHHELSGPSFNVIYPNTTLKIVSIIPPPSLVIGELALIKVNVTNYGKPADAFVNCTLKDPNGVEYEIASDRKRIDYLESKMFFPNMTVNQSGTWNITKCTVYEIGSIIEHETKEVGTGFEVYYHCNPVCKQKGYSYGICLSSCKSSSNQLGIAGTYGCDRDNVCCCGNVDVKKTCNPYDRRFNLSIYVEWYEGDYVNAFINGYSKKFYSSPFDYSYIVDGGIRYIKLDIYKQGINLPIYNISDTITCEALPSVQITVPIDGEIVKGTKDVIAKVVNSNEVKFYIDDVFVVNVSKKDISWYVPWYALYYWNTTIYSNGLHKINATACNIHGCSFHAITVNVSNIYDFTFDPISASGSSEQGGYLEYSFKLKNTGNMDDMYTITVATPMNWSYVPLINGIEKNAISLTLEKSAEIIVNISIPLMTKAGEVVTWNVTVKNLKEERNFSYLVTVRKKNSPPSIKGVWHDPYIAPTGFAP